MRNDIQNIEDQKIKSKRSRPINFLTVVFILTWVALIWFGWNAWSSYQKTKTEKEYQSKIEKLLGTIIHLDEVLTMSARMAAVTGDLQWEKRYRNFEPKLDAAIKEAMRLAPEAYSGKAAADTDAANIRLVKMENQSFDLIRQGRIEEAKALLFSDKYDKQKRIYAQGMTKFAKHKDLYLRLEELRGIIIHLDEVLTMSARMAAATGDLQWEKRYRSFEPKLDAAIKEAMRLAPAAYSGKAASDTDAANIRLVKMENHSFDLVRQGRIEEARALLFSNEYEEQKRIYAQGMTNFAAGLSITASTIMKDEQQYAFLRVGVVFLLIPLLIIVWFVTLRVVSNWEETLISKERLEKEIAERELAEEALRKRTHELGERVKQLNCLYGISNLVEKPHISLDEIFQGVADIIPPSWQYPEITCARIILESQEYRTQNFRKTVWKQAADIVMHNHRVGVVGVYYLEEKPKIDEGPFLKEERYLIKVIAERLGHIYERNKADEEKRSIEAQLLQSEKMASIGQLAAGVAHEINNPTGFVSSNLRTLSEYLKDTNKLMREYRKMVANLKENTTGDGALPDISGQVQHITALEEEVDIDFIVNDISDLIEESREGTERIKKIVQDLKDFAHPGEDKQKFVDINSNLDSTLNVVSNEIKYKAAVIKDYGKLPEVKCYPQQLNQVFVNVLVNAAQAIEKEGEIRIKTRANNGNVQVTISDTGKGIPKENLSKIFDPFFTTKKVGSGTGLGMNVAYNIIKKHNGTIDVESTVGTGTTFTIRIPAE